MVDAGADGLIQRRIGFGIFGADGRAMPGDVDGADRSGGRERTPCLIEQFVQETLLDRTGTAATGDEHIHWLPRPSLAHAIDEAAHFERALRVLPGKIFGDLLPDQIDAFLELGSPDTRRPGIGFEVEA